MSISHNPEDYSRKIRALVETLAEELYNGDVQRSWDDYFDTLERQIREFDSPTTTAAVRKAKLHLKAATTR